MIPTRIARHIGRAHTIGFIGLGAMGRNMAANLLSKSFANQEGVFEPGKPKPAFVVYDAFQPSVDAFLNEHVRAYAGRDVIPASSPAGVARLAGTVFTMLPSSPQVEEVYLGENGLLDGIKDLDQEKRAGSMFVDCTTLDQGVAKEVAKRMAALGAGMIDAPVSGGTRSRPAREVDAARELTRFCGADRRDRRSGTGKAVVHGWRTRRGVRTYNDLDCRLGLT